MYFWCNFSLIFLRLFLFSLPVFSFAMMFFFHLSISLCFPVYISFFDLSTTLFWSIPRTSIRTNCNYNSNYANTNEQVEIYKSAKISKYINRCYKLHMLVTRPYSPDIHCDTVYTYFILSTYVFVLNVLYS